MTFVLALGLLSMPQVAQAKPRSKPKPCHARYVREHRRCLRLAAKPAATKAVAPKAAAVIPAASAVVTAPAAGPSTPAATPAPIQTQVSWTGVQGPITTLPCESWIPKHGKYTPPLDPYEARAQAVGCKDAQFTATAPEVPGGEYEWRVLRGCAPIFPSVEGTVQDADAWDWHYEFLMPNWPEQSYLTASPPVPAPDCEGAVAAYVGRTTTGSLTLGIGYEVALNELTLGPPTSPETETQEAEPITIWNLPGGKFRTHYRTNIEGPRNDGPLIMQVSYAGDSPAFIGLTTSEGLK
jgi:hypothetical protein